MIELLPLSRLGWGPSGTEPTDVSFSADDPTCDVDDELDPEDDGDGEAEADAAVTLTVSAAAGGVHVAVADTPAVAVSFTELTEVASPATAI
jgi:hypothetical protein